MRLRKRMRAVAVLHPSNSIALYQPPIEALERRTLMSVNFLVHHGDAANDGANLTETVLSPSDLNPTDFGRQFTTAVDGQVNAQPLYVQDVDITRGSAVGVHSVAYVATMHDSLYAIDADTGAILWQDSFLNISDPTNLSATAGVTTVPASEAGITPETGIWSTPAIDLARGELFLNADTQEVRGSDTHFVQRLWAIRLTDGTPVIAPAVIGDTISNGPRLSFTGYVYVSGPIVAGSGNNATPTRYPNTDGWASAPGGATTPVIAFNALVQGERPAVTIMGGNIYLAFAGHLDESPYYGWILGYNETTLALTAAFVTTPTYEGIATNSTTWTAQGGVWASGSAIATDGTSLFVATGPGAFNVAASNFNAQGFPIDHDYADSLIKLQVDTSSSSTNQNGNGWGLKVVDYFTPSNAYELGQKNLDLGSGGVTLLPDTIKDSAGDPLLVLGTKESRLYVIDQDNLGKFNYTYPLTSNPDPRSYDRVVNEYAADGTDGTTQGIYNAPAYANGIVYVGQMDAGGLAFSATALASGQAVTPLQTTPSYGYAGPTYTVSANGSTGGVVWGMNYATSDLLAYNASNITAPIYDSNTVSGDAYTGGTKFAVVTVANGMAYLATNADTFVGFGLRTAYLGSNPAFFTAPAQLAVSLVLPTDAHLVWTSHSSLADAFRIDRSTDGKTWTTLSYVFGAATSYDDTTITAGTVFDYRVEAVSGSSVTAASNMAVLAPALSGKIIGIAGSYQNDGNTIAKAFDGNLSTFFDAPTATGNWVGLDLGSATMITSIAYTSRSGFASRMNGGIFQASSTADFSSGVVNLYTIASNASPSSVSLTTQTISNATAFRYVRYLSPGGSYGNVAEIDFFGTAPAAPMQFTGTAIGTTGSYQNDGNTIAKAVDGNLSTFFDGPAANGNWVGLDLGSTRVIQQISFAPRDDFASRMVGGIFQASNSATFSSGVVNLYTVTTAPTQNVLTTVSISMTTAYRYVRYLSPSGSYGNIAEIEFYG